MYFTVIGLRSYRNQTAGFTLAGPDIVCVWKCMQLVVRNNYLIAYLFTYGKVKVKCTIPHEECRQGAHLPSLGQKFFRWIKHVGKIYMNWHSSTSQQSTHNDSGWSYMSITDLWLMKVSMELKFFWTWLYIQGCHKANFLALTLTFASKAMALILWDLTRSTLLSSKLWLHFT